MSNNKPNNRINKLFNCPTFDKVLKLFVLAFEIEDYRTSFLKYYIPTVEIKDYNILIDQQPFFELPVRNKKNLMKEFLVCEKTRMIIQLVVCWIMNIF